MHGSNKCCGGGWRTIAWILVIIGAINWGLVGIGMFAGINLNIVNLIFGGAMWLEAIIYILVGLSGVMLIFSSCGHKKCCSTAGDMNDGGSMNDMGNDM